VSTSPNGSAVVTAREVTRRYGEGDMSVNALRGISLDVARGNLTAVMGPSGSGKSTLMHILAGLDKPTSGEVTIDGTSITTLGDTQLTKLRREHIGFVFQFFNLIPTLTVLENVLLPAELAGAQLGNGTTKRALELLDRVGLADRRSVFPDKLSGGEQQRVAIARALVRNPRLVLADEPTGNLDDANAKAVMALLSEMTHQAGKTLIMVTHSRKMAALADRVLTIEEGKIVEKQEA